MSGRISRFSRLGFLTTVVAMAAALGLLKVCWDAQRPKLLASYVSSQLQSAPDDQIDAGLDHLSAQGDAGVRAVVKSLNSSRQLLAQHAYQHLVARLTASRLKSADAISAESATQASALSELAPGFDPTGKSLASELASRILLQPVASGFQGREVLLNQCATVLKLSAQAAADSAKRPWGSNASVDSDRAGDDDLHHGIISSRLPGGGLTSDPFRQPMILTPGALDDSNSKQPPGRFQPSAETKELVAEDSDEALALQRQAASNEVAVTAIVPRSGDLMATDPLVLMRDLHSPDAWKRQAAERELQRRGCGQADLVLARKLTDADPAVRRRLAEALPSLNGVDAKPWYLWLSEDHDPNVRLTAIACMATSGDPELLTKVRDMSLEDADPRVRDQASRMTR